MPEVVRPQALGTTGTKISIWHFGSATDAANAHEMHPSKYMETKWNDVGCSPALSQEPVATGKEIQVIAGKLKIIPMASPA